MEEEIEEFLKDNYKNLEIEVKFNDFRNYIIILTFPETKAKIDFTYDNHFTFECNMQALENYINNQIIKYYRKKVK